MYIYHNINFTNILSQRTNTDAMAPIAMHMLNQDLCCVRLERDAIVPVINDGILHHGIRATIQIPAIRILGLVSALTISTYVNTIKHNIR